MEPAELVFRDENRTLRIQARLAQTGNQRGASMLHLCSEVVHANPMLFMFNAPNQPGFHMNNVHVKLDIVFVDDSRRVTEIRRMVPGGGLTSPEHPSSYALGLLAGETENLGLVPGMQMDIGSPH